MAQGWLRLHRSMADHWLWTEERVFSKAEAWLDLLMMVNHADGKVMMNGRLMEVKLRLPRPLEISRVGSKTFAITRVRQPI